MTNKSKILTILGVAVVIALMVLTADYFADQTNGQNISFETTSSSSQYFRLQSELPAKNMVGANMVRSYISQQNEEFITLAKQEGPEVAAQRGSVVQFTQDVLVDATTTEKFISYKVEIGTYTGGANANSVVETFVFSKSGQRLTNDDLIVANQQEAFMVAVRAALEGNQNTFPDVSQDVSFPQLNLFVTKDSILVPFSEYEVGPGAAGIITVIIPRGGYLSE